MEIIQFEKLFKGKAHARKDKVNAAFKKHPRLQLLNMETRESMEMTADVAKERFSHKIQLKDAAGGHPGELLYFEWLPDPLPF